MSKQPKISIKSRVLIKKQDLPLSCPMPQMTLWHMHPKVYLHIEKQGYAICPYCGTRYVLN